jgi:long-chain fatty acid transport protein
MTIDTRSRHQARTQPSTTRFRALSALRNAGKLASIRQTNARMSESWAGRQNIDIQIFLWLGRLAMGCVVYEDAARRWILAVISQCLLLAPSPAVAGGFFSPFQSTTAIGTAFAGATARNDDASFFFYNPSSISSLNGRQTFMDVRGFAPTVEITPSSATSALGTNIVADGASGNLTHKALAVGGVTVLPLAPGLTLGIGSSAPFATHVSAPSDWAGRYHLVKSYMVGMNVTGALSIQATPWLAIAGGVQVQRMENHFKNMALIPVAFPPPEAQAYLKADSWAAAAAVGVTLTPSEGTRLGLSWRSAMTHRMKGTTGVDRSDVAIEQVRYDLDLPQTFSAGLEQRLSPQWRLFAEWQWVDWSHFKGFEFSFTSGRPNAVRPIYWSDTWLAAAGLGYRLIPSTELTFGVSHDKGASRTGSGSTLSPDSDKTMIGLGIIHDIPGAGRLSLSYGHLFLSDSRVHAASLESGKLEGTLTGKMHMVGLGYTLKW